MKNMMKGKAMKIVLLPTVLGVLFSLLTIIARPQSSFLIVADTTNPAVNFKPTPAPYKGTAWIDLDRDHNIDLFVAPNVLFKNLGRGQFIRLPNTPWDMGQQLAAGGTWGDLDNDGDPDLLTANRNASLFRQEKGVFQKINDLLPGLGNDYPAWDCALADPDANGRLDPLWVHARGFHPAGPFPAKFYLQDQQGNFQAFAGIELCDSLAPYTIPVWADYDLDGDLDLFVGSGPGGKPGLDFCYKNLLRETGKFALERLSKAPFGQMEDGQVYSFPDVDNDGDRDICLSNYMGAPSRFWRNENGQYRPEDHLFTTRRANLSNTWADLDNDGDQDGVFTKDSAAYVIIYWNDGEGNYRKTQTPAHPGRSVAGISIGDYDNDGDLDFYTNGGANARTLYQNALSTMNNWVQLTLEGVSSNRSAIGTLLRLKAKIEGKWSWQMREISAHNSFQSQNDLRAHFGLGNATRVDSLEIRWPSGKIEHYRDLRAKQFFHIQEGGVIKKLRPKAKPLHLLDYDSKSAQINCKNLNAKSIAKITLTNKQGQAQAFEGLELDREKRLKLPAMLEKGWYDVQFTDQKGRCEFGRLWVKIQ
jgi:enediyne biosynthesis protein E4